MGRGLFHYIAKHFNLSKASLLKEVLLPVSIKSSDQLLGSLNHKNIYLLVLLKIIGCVKLLWDNRPNVSVQILPPLGYCATIMG